MMTATTGATREKPCSRCGTTVTHEEQVALTGDRLRWWKAQRHLADCGADCLGGGILGKERVTVWKQHRAAGCKTCAADKGGTET